MIDLSLKRRKCGKDKQERIKTNHEFDQVISSTFKNTSALALLQESVFQKGDFYSVYLNSSDSYSYPNHCPNHPKAVEVSALGRP